MIIRYQASVRATTGERQLRWETPAATPRDLALHYDLRFKYWILTRGNAPDQHIVIRIKGHNSSYLDGADTPLQTDGTISLASTMRLRPTW